MKINEAYEALSNTFKNIKSEAEEKGITATYKCFTSDRDLIEVDINDDNVSLIAGEFTLGAEGTEEKIILECAVSITDGEIFDDEVIREITAIRESIRELYAKIDETGSAAAALSDIYKEEEQPQPPAKTYDNKMFYIYGGLAILVVAIILIISKAF